MEADVLTVAVVVLALSTAALTGLVVWLVRERVAQASQRQTAQDLLEENLVHALAELTLRTDALVRELHNSQTDDGNDASQATHDRSQM